MNSFSEQRFENGIVTLAMDGGAEFSTTVITVNSGFEQRNQNWTQARGKWQLGNRTVSPSEYHVLNSFMRARRGKFQGFRLKDWLDYKDDGDGVLGASGQVGDPTAGVGIQGRSEYQLFKRYASGDDAYFRKIAKPVNDGTLKVFAGGVQLSIGLDDGQYVPDFTTGKITIAPTTKAVMEATNATDAVLTCAGHGLVTGNRVLLTGFVSAWAGVNGQTLTVTVLTPDTFRIPLNSTALGVFTGGSIRWWIQPGVALTWTGEFDVPVRFDVDSFTSRLEAVIHGPEGISNNSKSYVTIGNVPVIEIRV